MAVLKAAAADCSTNEDRQWQNSDGHLWRYYISGLLEIILNSSAVLLNPENIGLAVEIAFLSCLQAEI